MDDTNIFLDVDETLNIGYYSFIKNPEYKRMKDTINNYSRSADYILWGHYELLPEPSYSHGFPH